MEQGKVFEQMGASGSLNFLKVVQQSNESEFLRRFRRLLAVFREPLATASLFESCSILPRELYQVLHSSFSFTFWHASN